jgi:syntaxin-binding protein 1
VIDRRYWTPPIGPPALAPPPGAPRPGPPQQTNSSFVNKMADLSLGKDKDRDSMGGSGSKKDGEKKEKKSLFKMKW